MASYRISIIKEQPGSAPADYVASVYLTNDAGKSTTVFFRPGFKTYALAYAAAQAYIASNPLPAPTPAPTPTPIPGPSPVPGPGPTPWDDKTDGGGWDIVVPVDDRGGGTYAGWESFGVSGSAWEYPSMWFEASPWGSDSMWNYSNAWTGFTSAGSWDSGGTWGDSSSGWLTGLASWFGSLFS